MNYDVWLMTIWTGKTRPYIAKKKAIEYNEVLKNKDILGELVFSAVLVMVL